MNFERDQESFEALGVGQKVHPITIISAKYPVRAGNDISWFELHNNNLSKFLDFIEGAHDKPIGEYYSIAAFMEFDIIDEISMKQKEVDLHYLKGRMVRVEFEERLYKINKNIRLDK